MSWWTRHRHEFNPVHAVDELIKGANYEAEHVLGWEADPTGQNGGGTGPGEISLNVSTPTDFGFDLEGKQLSLDMGQYAPGGYTEMLMNNGTTAYQEEKKEDKGWGDYAMDALTTIGGAAATALINNQYNKEMQHSQNKFNAAEAEKNRQWETEMANTAHQREFADLIATGLNPVNTATGGGGAATPGGATAAGANPPYMDAGVIGNTALSLAETMKTLSENKYISREKKAQIANTVADTATKEASTGLTKAQTQESQANTEKAYEIIKNFDADTKLKLKQAGYTEQETANAIKERELLEEQISNAKADTDVKKAEAEIKAWEARHPIIARTLNAIGGVAGGVVGGTMVGAGKNVFSKKPGKIGF